MINHEFLNTGEGGEQIRRGPEVGYRWVSWRLIAQAEDGSLDQRVAVMGDENI